MTEDSSQEVERYASEEKNEHGSPFCGFDDGGEEDFFAEPVTQHGESERGKHVEDYGHADEDFPGSEVELIERVVEPAYHDVVYEGEGDGTSDGVVFLMGSVSVANCVMW